MKKILISYADNNMSYSLKRIGKQAHKMNIFDEVLLYTPKDLPNYIQSSPLMQYVRGGGYWAWKPAIIWETLQKNEEGAIVVYVDAGCSLRNTSDWNNYFNLLKNNNAICFEYKDQMPEWSIYGQTSTKIKFWTKKSTLDYFRLFLNDNDYGEKYNKIWGGAILLSGKDNPFVRKWLDITLYNPELIIDPDEVEIKTENSFLAYHKHDQSIITPLAHWFKDEVVILEEKAETSTSSNITGSRIRAKTYKDYILLKIKAKLRMYLGNSYFDKLKSLIKE